MRFNQLCGSFENYASVDANAEITVYFSSESGDMKIKLSVILVGLTLLTSCDVSGHKKLLAIANQSLTDYKAGTAFINKNPQLETTGYKSIELPAKILTDSIWDAFEFYRYRPDNRSKYSQAMYHAITSDKLVDIGESIIFSSFQFNSKSDTVYFSGDENEFSKWEKTVGGFMESNMRGDSISFTFWKKEAGSNE